MKKKCLLGGQGEKRIECVYSTMREQPYGYKNLEEEWVWYASLLGDHAENAGKRMILLAF